MAKQKKHPAETEKSLESWIWDAACSIRGAKDAPKYKDYILPLIFTKRLCDVFDAETYRPISEIAEELWGKGGLEEQARKVDAALKDILHKTGIAL